MTRARARGGAVFVEQPQLVALGGCWLVRVVGRRFWYHLAAKRGVARQDPPVTQLVAARRWHHGHEPRNELLRLKHQRLRTVLPSALQLELEQSVSAAREAVLGERGPHYVLAQSLQPRAFAPVDHLLGVYVDPAHLGHRLIEFGRASDAVRSVVGLPFASVS